MLGVPPLRVQLAGGLNVPLPLVPNVTVPVGALVVPESVSATVAVQVLGEPTSMDVGMQPTSVEVVRLLTANIWLPDVPPPLKPLGTGLVTEASWAPIVAAAVAIVIFAVMEVLLLTFVELTFIPDPEKLTVASFAKFMPARVRFMVFPRSALAGERLDSVGAGTAVA